MSFDEATRMLGERCGLDPATALDEARMAASDPSAMVYTHAVSSLVAMRDDARLRLGPRFHLRNFVDAALRYGGVPPQWVRAQAARDPTSGITASSGAAP
jgi:uncharacterized protein (DUF885 family)